MNSEGGHSEEMDRRLREEIERVLAQIEVGVPTESRKAKSLAELFSDWCDKRMFRHPLSALSSGDSSEEAATALFWHSYLVDELDEVKSSAEQLREKEDLSEAQEEWLGRRIDVYSDLIDLRDSLSLHDILYPGGRNKLSTLSYAELVIAAAKVLLVPRRLRENSISLAGLLEKAYTDIDGGNIGELQGFCGDEKVTELESLLEGYERDLRSRFPIHDESRGTLYLPPDYKDVTEAMTAEEYLVYVVRPSETSRQFWE
jgi:hypothetical protein